MRYSHIFYSAYLINHEEILYIYVYFKRAYVQ